MTELVARPGSKVKVPAKNVGLSPLPPIALALATEQGIDPRTHHRSEHAAIGREWAGLIKKVRQMRRPDPADVQIQADLRAADLPVWNDARSNPLPMPDETGVVHVITDLPAD